MRKRILSLALVLLMVFALMPLTALAAGSGVRVTYAGQVVDSMTYNGVTINAVYAPRSSVSNYDSDTTYCCAALVKRFYSQVYGITVYNLSSTTSTPLVSGGSGSFTLTSSPQVGDIIRDNQSVHWAIVKAVNGTNISVFQQNAWWDSARTQAWVGAVFSSTDSRYSFFRYSGSTPVDPGTISANFDTSHEVYNNATAKVSTTVTMNNASISQLTSAGVIIYNSAGTEIGRKEENVSYSTSYMNIWYTVGSGQEVNMTLTPGAVYKYKFFVRIGNNTYSDSMRSFTAGGAPAAVSANFNTTSEVYNNATAKVSTTVTMNNATISQLTSAGVVIYDSNGNEIGRRQEPVSYNTSYMNIWYTVGAGQEINMTLTPGAVYKYQFFVCIGNDTYADSTRSFTAGGTSGTVSANYSTTHEVYDNATAKVSTTVTMNNATISQLTSAGVVIYDSHDNEIGGKEEAVSYSTSYMNIWYTLGAGQEINMTLNPGTVYKYKFFVRIGNSTYYDAMRTFTTNGSGVKLNVDGLLNGTSSSTTGSCGTFDVYVRGKQVANDVNEYNTSEHYGSAYEIKDIKAKDGYTYKGVSSGSLTGTIYGSTVNVVLKFDKTASDVTLNPNGGSVVPTTISVTPGGTYGALPTPKRSGCQFKGWYTSANGGSVVTSNTTVRSDVTVLYAHWDKPYAVTGGSILIGLNDLSNGNAVVSGCDSAVTDAVVPSSVEGKTVTEVNADVFKNLTNLRTLVLPNTITSIQGNNFIGCTALEAVYIPASVAQMTTMTGTDYSNLTMDVYFGGSESAWNQIWSSSAPFNGTGSQIKVHFNCPDPQDFAITQQPQSITAQAGGTVVLTVSTAGNGVSYQWQSSPAGSSSWTNCGSGSVLQIAAASARNGERFRCIATDVFGTSATSSVATLTVNGSIDNNPFVDVAKGKFYYDPVLWAISQNPKITTGVDDTHFEPDRICTRAHVVTFLWRANGCPAPHSMTSSFKDVKDTNKYYYKAVLWASEQGITTGYSDGTFRPDDECTRGQVVTFLWRAKGQPAPTGMSNPFTDVPAGKYYTNAVLWALQNSITQGRTPTTFGPDDACTRGHVVTFLYRAYA